MCPPLPSPTAHVSNCSRCRALFLTLSVKCKNIFWSTLEKIKMFNLEKLEMLHQPIHPPLLFLTGPAADAVEVHVSLSVLKLHVWWEYYFFPNINLFSLLASVGDKLTLTHITGYRFFIEMLSILQWETLLEWFTPCQTNLTTSREILWWHQAATKLWFCTLVQNWLCSAVSCFIISSTSSLVLPEMVKNLPRFPQFCLFSYAREENLTKFMESSTFHFTRWGLFASCKQDLIVFKKSL